MLEHQRLALEREIAGGTAAAFETDFARIGREQAMNGTQQHRLAGAVGADQRADAGSAPVEIDRVQDRALAGAEGDGAQAQQRVGGR